MKWNLPTIIDTHFGNLRAINFEVADLLNRFRFIGVLPGTQVFIDADAEEDIPEVKEFRSFSEGSPVETKKKSLLCDECGFVAKNFGALNGHIRFKHKR